MSDLTKEQYEEFLSCQRAAGPVLSIVLSFPTGEEYGTNCDIDVGVVACESVSEQVDRSISLYVKPAFLSCLLQSSRRD